MKQREDQAVKSKLSLKRLISLFVSFSFIISGCSTNTTRETDIISLKKTEEGRTPITILVKYAFSINQFEKIVEEKFPDIDIIQVGNYTSNTTLAKEYEARLEHDDLTDIVMTWPLDVGEEYWKDRLIDLSGLPFTSKYNTTILDTIADKENSLYYIPGPASIRGIVYNKTMFNENGWSVPNNYTEFIALCKTIEASGNRAFQLPLGNTEVLDTAFVGFNYGNAYSKPTDIQWIADYNNGQGDFIEHFGDSLDTFQNLIDEGVLKEEDLNMHYADTQDNLVNRRIVMTEESVQMTKDAATMGNETDEFAIMPFFNRSPENNWVRLYMTCYIGLNKNLQNKDQHEKYEKVLKLMDYISTPEGQNILASDNGALYSSLKGVETPDIKEIEDLQSSLSQGRYGTFPTLERSNNALRKGLAAMLKKEMNAVQAAQLVDNENKNTHSEVKEEVLATASKDFTFIETGNLVCDILKQEANTELALFLDNGKDGQFNGKGISAKLYQGDVTETDLTRLFPDLKTGETGKLVKAVMSGENIVNALEYSIPINSQDGWFYYFSGLKVKMDLTAPIGSRIKEITMDNGNELIKNKDYTVAIMEYSVADKYITSMEHTDKFIIDILRENFIDMKTLIPSKDNRFIT